MNIIKNIDESKLTVTVEGRLDSKTAPMLEGELFSSCKGITELVLDFEALEYISSAGLRVLLAAQKMMNKQGSMVIRNINETVREVLDITGFSDIFMLE